MAGRGVSRIWMPAATRGAATTWRYWHFPETQLAPAPHTLPQVPQFDASVATLVSQQLALSPSQSIIHGSGPQQLTSHLPEWQVAPGPTSVEQSTPQLPQ